MQRPLPACRPNVRLFIDGGDYIIKTAERRDELFRALQLRHRIFYQELLNQKAESGVDLDEYDVLCDHLVVVEKRTKDVVGTYRLNASLFSDHFYSEQEFVLDDLLSRPGAKVELGRACIRQDHRSGLIFNLLWKGIFKYLQSVEARYLFGCSSVPTVNLGELARMGHYFRDRGFVDDGYGVRPRRALPVATQGSLPTRLPEGALQIPPLLLFYLRGGARLGGQPAIDDAFRCADFMTILDMGRVNHAFARYFSRC